jgi:hypothetical protein
VEQPLGEHLKVCVREYVVSRRLPTGLADVYVGPLTLVCLSERHMRVEDDYALYRRHVTHVPGLRVIYVSAPSAEPHPPQPAVTPIHAPMKKRSPAPFFTKLATGSTFDNQYVTAIAPL